MLLVHVQVQPPCEQAESIIYLRLRSRQKLKPKLWQGSFHLPLIQNLLRKRLIRLLNVSFQGNRRRWKQQLGPSKEPSGSLLLWWKSISLVYPKGRSVTILQQMGGYWTWRSPEEWVQIKLRIRSVQHLTCLLLPSSNVTAMGIVSLSAVTRRSMVKWFHEDGDAFMWDIPGWQTIYSVQFL